MDIEIDDLQLYWLAGILEGEGSFMNGRNIVNGKLYLYPKIVVTMTDKDIIDRVAHLFETSTYNVPDRNIENHKAQYRAQINGARAAAFMNRLSPIMGERRSEKISEILEAYGDVEPTEVRMARNCSEAQTKRWAMHGTRTGKLTDTKGQ